MAIRHFDVTLSGNTQITDDHTPCTWLFIENPAGNATVLVGNLNLSASSYGMSVAAGTGREINAGGRGTFDLSMLRVRGTDTEVVHVLAITGGG